MLRKFLSSKTKLINMNTPFYAYHRAFALNYALRKREDLESFTLYSQPQQKASTKTLQKD